MPTKDWQVSRKNSYWYLIDTEKKRLFIRVITAQLKNVCFLYNRILILF